MSGFSLPNSPFAAQLLARIATSASQPALEEKRRGQWRFRRWRDVGAEVSRLAAGLSRLGVAKGSVVAIDAEIGGHIVLIGAAALALEASLLSVPTRASREARDRVLDDASVALVVGQGREVAAEWTAIARAGRRFAIVFDHATAGGRSPDEGVVTYDGLRALGAEAAFDFAHASAGASALPRVWVEEATDWRLGLDVLLNAWVAEGWTLALPELLAAAGRDRREARPRRWLASAATLEQTLERLHDRIPASRLTAGSASSPLLRARLRRLLGLGGVTSVELYAGDRDALSPECADVFAWLGAPVRDARASTEGQGAGNSNLSLSLAGAAP